MTEHIRIIRHEIASLKTWHLRFPDGRPSSYFYFDDHPGRRAIAGNLVNSKRASTTPGPLPAASGIA
jgi:hypothetical protein